MVNMKILFPDFKTVGLPTVFLYCKKNKEKELRNNENKKSGNYAI